MPPDCMELWARRFEIQEGLLGSQVGSLALLLQGYLDDCTAADCISQQMVFWMGRHSGYRRGSSWPGRVWHGYSSVGVLEG